MAKDYRTYEVTVSLLYIVTYMMFQVFGCLLLPYLALVLQVLVAYSWITLC